MKKGDTIWVIFVNGFYIIVPQKMKGAVQTIIEDVKDVLYGKVITFENGKETFISND